MTRVTHEVFISHIRCDSSEAVPTSQLLWLCPPPRRKILGTSLSEILLYKEYTDSNFAVIIHHKW